MFKIQYRNTKMYTPTDRGSLSVHGTSSLEVNSDSAKLNVRVSTENKSLEEAKNLNDKILQRLITSLYDYNIPKENIHSENVSAIRNYDPKTNTIISYKVTQLVTILVDNLSKLNDIYSLVVENGANDDISVDFILSNPNYYYNKALKKAAQDALNKANVLAKSFGLKYNPLPYKVTELSSSLYSITYSSSSTNYYQGISPGVVKITAEIESIFATYQF